MKMLKYLQSKVSIRKDIRNGDIVYWMTRKERKKVAIYLTEKQESLLNSSYDVFWRGENIKMLL